MKKVINISLIALAISIVTISSVEARPTRTTVQDTKSMLHAKTQKDRAKASLKVLADISSTPEDKEAARIFFTHNSLKKIIDKKQAELAQLEKEFNIISKEKADITADMTPAEVKKLDYVTIALGVTGGVVAAYATYKLGVAGAVLNALQSGAGMASSAAQKVWGAMPSVFSSKAPTPPVEKKSWYSIPSFSSKAAPTPAPAPTPGYLDTATDLAKRIGKQAAYGAMVAWTTTKLLNFISKEDTSAQEKAKAMDALEAKLDDPATPEKEKALIRKTLGR